MRPASFAVTVDGDLSGAVKLRYETAPGTATAEDYTASSDTVSIPDENYNTPITVAIEDDPLAEGEETFTLNLSLMDAPDNVVLAATTAEATITDNDDLRLILTSLSDTVTEGSDANFPVTVTGGTSTADVVVKYTVENTNDDDEDKNDYEDPGTTLTIPAGTETATIVISIVEDDVLEPAETLQVTLKDPTTAAGSFAEDPITGSPAMTDIVEAGTVTVSMVDTAVTVTEGGEALFPVRLSGKVSANVTVAYTVTGVTTVAADYDAPQTQTVIIEAGETTGTIAIDTEPDTQAENDEQFTVRLSMITVADTNLSDSVVYGTRDATATIRDDDRLTVTIEGPDGVPPSATTTDFKVRLRGGTPGTGNTVTVKYSVDGVEQTQTVTMTGTETDVDIPAITVGTGQSLEVRLTDVDIGVGTVSLGSPREKRATIVSSTTVIVSVDDPIAVVDENDITVVNGATISASASFRLTRQGASPLGVCRSPLRGVRIREVRGAMQAAG